MRAPVCHDRTRGLRADLVGQSHQDDVHVARRLGGRERLEDDVGAPFQLEVHGGDRLADVIDRRDARELDVRMHDEAPNELGAPRNRCRR